MAYSRRYTTWQNWPSTTTPVDAAFLQGVEDLLADVGSGEDGDNQQGFPTQGVTSARYLDVRKGTTGVPDTSLVPLVRVQRYQQVTSGIVGDGSEQLCALEGISVGTSSTQGQPLGVMGVGKTASTQSGQNDDACGVYGLGRVTDTGTGIGIGVVGVGRRDTSTGNNDGAQFTSDNSSGVAGTLNATGRSNCNGVWVVATGTEDSSCGIQMGQEFGYQFVVGLHFNGAVNGGKTGPASTASIRDDGNATTVMDINGSHTTGIDLEGATLTGDAIKVGGSQIRFTERSDPSAPSTNNALLYAKDNGAGKTQLVVRFPTGAVQVVATEP